MRILLVEDDEIFTQVLVHHLTAQRYAIDVATDGVTGLSYAQSASYDLIVLDVNLPELDGIRLCQRLRQERFTGPILLLTAKGDSSDKVMGLDAGADDYVVKPCTVDELSARIRALLRRQNPTGAPVLEWGSLRLNPGTYEVTYEGQLIALSPKEYGLLELFLRNPQRVFSSSTILEHLWSFEDAPAEETVRSHIKRLRRKLKAVGVEDIVDTIYGMGYRLKPMSQGVESSTASADTARAAAIAAWEQFQQPILERVTVLDQATAALQSGQLSEELRQAAEGAAHKLAGSLAMFGFPQGTQLGREIEAWFQMVDVGDLGQLQSWLAELHQLLQQPPQSWENEESTSLSLQPSDPVMGLSRLLVVDDDQLLTRQLHLEGTKRGMQIEVAADVDEARIKLIQRLPDVLLLDLAFPDATDQGLVFLEELTAHYPTLPVLVFTIHDSFSDRLSVARRGSYRFVSKATPLAQVFDTIDEILKRQGAAEINVLVVDDDPLILNLLKQFLPRWGIHPTTLDDPRQIWKTLETLTPDLLILDLDMPYTNGIEVCRVIRNDSAWSGLPILFLTAHRDTETVLQLYNAGADDYVTKPFTEPELVTRIFNRLERTRLLKNLAETDQLTGVANRHHSTRELNRYLRLSYRQNQPFCVAVIDLDRFKQVNDQYGHDVGDLVLKRFSSLLRQQFRSEDVIARWGGEEFLVGMYGITKSQAADRLHQILSLVRQETFPFAALPPLQLTFSAGVAEAPGDGRDLQDLYRIADAAMYRAKAAGRDRILLA